MLERWRWEGSNIGDSRWSGLMGTRVASSLGRETTLIKGSFLSSSSEITASLLEISLLLPLLLTKEKWFIVHSWNIPPSLISIIKSQTLAQHLRSPETVLFTDRMPVIQGMTTTDLRSLEAFFLGMKSDLMPDWSWVFQSLWSYWWVQD